MEREKARPSWFWAADPEPTGQTGTRCHLATPWPAALLLGVAREEKGVGALLVARLPPRPRAEKQSR